MSQRNSRLRKVALSALHYSGADSMIAPFTRGLGAILTLHHVSPDKPGAFEPNRDFKVTPHFIVQVIQQVRAEKLKALGITTARRSPLLPEVPTILESLPGYEVALWNGLLAPANTPPDIIDRINRATIEALRSPEVKAKLAEQGSEPVGNTPAEFKAFIESELVKWRRLVEISGATVQ